MAQSSNGSSSSLVSDLERRIGQTRGQLTEQLSTQAAALVTAVCDKVLEIVKANSGDGILVDEAQLSVIVREVMAKSYALQKDRFNLEMDIMYKMLMSTVLDGLHSSLGSYPVGFSGSSGGSSSTSGSSKLVRPKSAIRRSPFDMAFQNCRSLRSRFPRVSSPSLFSSPPPRNPSNIKRVHFSDQPNRIHVFELESGRRLARDVKDDQGDSQWNLQEDDDEDDHDDHQVDHQNYHQKNPELVIQNPGTPNSPSVPERIRLIKLAITNSPDQRLHLNQISDYFCAHAPYYANMDKRRRTQSISFLLATRKKHFIKFPSRTSNRDNLWAIKEKGEEGGGEGGSSSNKAVPNGSNRRVRTLSGKFTRSRLTRSTKEKKVVDQPKPESSNSGGISI